MIPQNNNEDLKSYLTERKQIPDLNHIALSMVKRSLGQSKEKSI